MKKQLLLFSLLLSITLSTIAQQNYYLNKYYLRSEIKKQTIQYAEVDYSNPIAVWEQELNIASGLSRLISFNLPKSLDCDIYTPNDDHIRPALILIHGGAFISGIGSIDDRSMERVAYEFAQRGYRVVSIEYRTMNLLTPSFIKAGYTATQDAKAAIKYIANHSKELFIDPNQLFIGGISAGAITAINAAFLDIGENIANREKKLERMYGCLDCVGETKFINYKIKGVINIAGGVYDPNILINNNIPLISFHGDNDQVVPMSCDTPFKKIIGRYNKFLDHSIKLAAPYPKLVKELKEGKVVPICGSKQIHATLVNAGKPSQFNEVIDGKHSLILSENNVFTQQGLNIITTASNFMYNLL